jgi:hypothetical protein
MRRLFAFLDPLLRGGAPIVEPYHCPTGQAQIRHDKADAREQLAGMVFDFRHDPPRLRLTACLIGKTLVSGPEALALIRFGGQF